MTNNKKENTMKKYLTFIITLNILLWFGLSSIANAHHKSFEQMYKLYNYGSDGSENYKKLETELIQENDYTKLIDKQLANNKKTALVNVVVFQNGKIVVDKSNYEGSNSAKEFKKNDNLLRSNSMGKSLVTYVVGHAVCQGYIGSVSQSVADWDVLNDTLYADNTLLQILNMTAGDHNFVGEYKYGQFKKSSDGAIFGKADQTIQKTSIARTMNMYFKGSKKKSNQYNYSALATHVAVNYMISKFDTAQDYEKFLTSIFRDHVGVKDRVSFQKTTWSSADFKEGNSRFTFFAKSHDYIRIADQIIKDYNSDSCIGEYLRFINDNKVNKGHDGYKPYQIGAITKQYGGQFHMGFIGIDKNRTVWGMDGHGGQQITLDMDNGTIIMVNSVDQHYNWKKIVYDVLKKGIK